MVDEEEYLRPFVVLDELYATKIFFYKKNEKKWNYTQLQEWFMKDIIWLKDAIWINQLS